MTINELKKFHESIEIIDNSYPNIFKEIKKYGVENIFFVSKNYYGRYEDDNCDFTYYNNITGEFIFDSWSTRFAAPNYFLYEKCISINEAIGNGIINLSLYNGRQQSEYINRILTTNILRNVKREYYRYNIPVVVNGGRKFKGNGYFIGEIILGGYYEDKLYYKIFDPQTNTIHEINPAYINIDESFINTYKEWAFSEILNTTDFINFNGNSISFENYIKNNKIEIDYSSATDIEEEKRNNKNAQFKSKKMKELIEWVKKNTDKQGEEIEKLAERIYKKRYE